MAVILQYDLTQYEIFKMKHAINTPASQLFSEEVQVVNVTSNKFTVERVKK